VQIPITLLPKSCAHNACGIVRHSTLWVKPEVVAQIEFLEWTGAKAAGSDYTCSSNTAREIPGHAFLSPAVWQRV
jgi:hypothetical protein